MKRFIIILVILLLTGCTQSKKESINRSELTIRADFPTAMQFKKDGTLLYTEKDGRLVQVKNFNEPEKRKQKVLLKVSVPKILTYNETGLLGLALLDANPNEVFLYKTFSKNGGLFNKVFKFNLSTKKIETLIDNIEGNDIHNGGKMTFGPDGMLYIGTGDAGEEKNAQDKESLNGKVLRIKSNGEVPSDNPFGNEVWSYGHRNIFGITFDDRGQLFVSENGPTENDEINLIKRGGNYGWPQVTGNQDNRYIMPVKTFKEVIAPTGIVFINDFRGLKDQLLVGSYLNGSVISLGENGLESDQAIEDNGKITDLALSPAGEFLIANTESIKVVEKF